MSDILGAVLGAVLGGCVGGLCWGGCGDGGGGVVGADSGVCGRMDEQWHVALAHATMAS